MARDKRTLAAGDAGVSSREVPSNPVEEQNVMTVETAPAVATPLEDARALAPRIRERAAEIEAARQLPADLVRDIANAGLFKVAVPEAEGGLGADIITALRVIEEVARADGSTGWCLAMAVNTFRQSAQFAPAVRREMFFSDPVGVSAGSANPRGRADAVAGGYRVTGHWFFASGCMHASSLHGACKVFDGDAPRLLPNGDQEIRIAYFYPKSIARIIDTWDVSGLRGTGSHDIEVDGLFVPEERTFSALSNHGRRRDLGDPQVPMEPNATMWGLATHPAADRILAWSLFGQVYVSEDAGDSWRKIAREFGEITTAAWLPN